MKSRTRIEFPGEPMPAARWKTTSGKGEQHRRYRKQCKDYKEWAAVQMIGQRYFEKGTRLCIAIHFYRKNNIVADWDNLAKAATDPLNGVVWHDDHHIDEGHVYVHRSVGEANAGVVIEVWAKE